MLLDFCYRFVYKYMIIKVKCSNLRLENLIN